MGADAQTLAVFADRVKDYAKLVARPNPDADLRALIDALGRLYAFVAAAELRDMLKEAGLAPEATREGEERGLAGTLDPFVIRRTVKPADA